MNVQHAPPETHSTEKGRECDGKDLNDPLYRKKAPETSRMEHNVCINMTHSIQKRSPKKRLYQVTGNKIYAFISTGGAG